MKQFREALDSHLKFTESGDGSWYKSWGSDDKYYYDGDALRNAATTNNGEQVCLQTIVESDSTETIKFHWKVSCQSNYDYLRFYIDGTLKVSITGEVGWQQKEYTVSSGIHKLKWIYDDGGGSSGDNCWVIGLRNKYGPQNSNSLNFAFPLLIRTAGAF